MRRIKVARKAFVAATALCGLGMTMLITGCQTKTDNNKAFRTALNSYYSNHQDCLFAHPIKFPETVNPKDQDQAKQFNALVYAGLLQPENTAHGRKGTYELSDIGRLDWTADQARTGYGDFCYGSPQVNKIQSFTQVASSSTPKYKVNYRDNVTLASWATVPQVKQAFPKVVKASKGETATATLTRSNSGWHVLNVSPSTATPMG